MQSGKLRKRVELHSATVKQQNEYGEQSEGFVKYATVWAEVKPLEGRELERARQLSAEVSYQVHIRYRSDVTVKHKVVFGTRTLEINAVINPDESNKELWLYCKEIK